MKRAGIRVFLAACAVLLVGLGAFNVRPTSAQDDPPILQIDAYLCPGGISTEQCGDPAANLQMMTLVGALGAEYEPLATDGFGHATYELTTSGFGIRFEVEIPEGFDYFEAYCGDVNGVEFAIGQGERSFNIPDQYPDGNLHCNLYFFENTATVPEDDGTIGSGGTVTLCTEAPEGEFGVWWVSPYCSAPSGVFVTIANAATGGSIYCEAEPADVAEPKAAGCSTAVPYGETIVVTLDESTIPDGYQLVSPNPQEFTAPDSFPDGILSHPFFMLLPIGTDAPDDLEEQAQSTAVAEVVEEVPAVEGRTVVLYSGDCDTIGDEIATLSDVLPEDGDVVGDEKAIKAEMSNTTGALFFLDAAIDEGMALVVYEDETTDTPIVCGELGGVNTHDGMLPIGLGEVDGSGFVGTAVLSYNDADETTTDVIIVISEELLPEPTGTPSN